MTDEAGRFTAEQTVMESGMEIRELKHLLEVRDEKIRELEQEIEKLKGPNPYDDVNYAAADSEEEEHEEEQQLSFELH